MDSALASALAFNRNLSLWNTGKVTDMDYMFDSATAFNGSIGTLKVASWTGADPPP
jgi:surface protein